MKKIYAFFIDFKAAFDMIDRRSLFYKLYNMGVSSKFVGIVQSLYSNTEALVWDGENLSHSFLTSSGVKQGCILSPLLFALFVNDLIDVLEVGVNMDGIEIKILLYADDIVVFSDDPIKLQRMIQDVEQYCKLWNLVVNLDKSKIMIFQRGGGVRKSTERWFFGNTEIDVVKEYTYLGIVLSPKLSLSGHLNHRLNAAKASLNSIWKQFMKKEDIKLSDKLKMFNAVSRSVLCYGAQVWGFLPYEQVEKLLRFFIKKLFLLPQQTPNYLLLLETGLSNIYIYTLKCHFNYLLRVLYKYDSERLPHIIATKIMEKNIYWFETSSELAEKHSLNFNIINADEQYTQRILLEIIEREDHWLKSKATDRARYTIRHGLYDKLEYPLNNPTYVRDDFSLKKINLIIKYRGGLINLNASPWRQEGNTLCSLCNLDEDEDLSHFFGRCPILSEFRLRAFNKKILTELEIINILNRQPDFNIFFTYITSAWKYRNFLVNESNN